MSSVAHAPQHLGLWLRAALSKGPIFRSASPAHTTREPTPIRRSPIDGDMIILRSVGAGALGIRWTLTAPLPDPLGHGHDHALSTCRTPLDREVERRGPT